MPEIIVIAGASGSGKSFLADNIRDLEPGVVLIKKKTNRPMREYEKIEAGQSDLIFDYTDGAFSKCEYRYTYAGYLYGFSKLDIENALQNGGSPIVIVRDSTIIQRIISDFPSRVLTMYLRSAFDGERLEKVLAQKGVSDIDREERLKRDELDIQQFVGSLEIYDAVILNDYNPETLITQARKQLQKFRSRRYVVDGYVFLIMPINDSMEEEHNAIIGAPAHIKAKSYHIERVDTIRGDYKINDQIIACINKAELIIADLSQERQNVYFELGYARGVGKEVLSVARKGTKLHFDINGFKTEFYTGPMDLQKKVVDYLRARLVISSRKA